MLATTNHPLSFSLNTEACAQHCITWEPQKKAPAFQLVKRFGQWEAWSGTDEETICLRCSDFSAAPSSNESILKIVIRAWWRDISLERLQCELSRLWTVVVWWVYCTYFQLPDFCRAVLALLCSSHTHSTGSWFAGRPVCPWGTLSRQCRSSPHTTPTHTRLQTDQRRIIFSWYHTRPLFQVQKTKFPQQVWIIERPTFATDSALLAQWSFDVQPLGGGARRVQRGPVRPVTLQKSSHETRWNHVATSQHVALPSQSRSTLRQSYTAMTIVRVQAYPHDFSGCLIQQ